MKIQKLMKIRHKAGFAYIARTKHFGLSSHKKPSTAVLMENGMPLPGPTNALHSDIGKLGNGRYSFWHGEVYFSSADNSDPRTNGRSYTIEYAENELYRFGIMHFLLNWTLHKASKFLNHRAMPGPIKNFLRAMGYSFEAIRRLRLLFSFWSFFYWISFFYVAFLRRKS